MSAFGRKDKRKMMSKSASHSLLDEIICQYSRGDAKKEIKENELNKKDSMSEGSNNIP